MFSYRLSHRNNHRVAKLLVRLGVGNRDFEPRLSRGIKTH